MQSTLTAVKPVLAQRALRATPAYWVTMLAASALGTNLGDFCGDYLGMGQGLSFALLAGLSALAVTAYSARGVGYWVAIIALRAAATNVADTMTHVWGWSYPAVSAVLLVLTLLAGAFTREADDAPLIDGRYWVAMLIAGVFGTAAGDLASHSFGLVPAALVLTLATAGAVVLRGAVAGWVLSYWAVVLVERCAGTPIGDALASRHGAGLGLPVSMTIMAVLVVAGLSAVRRGR